MSLLEVAGLTTEIRLRTSIVYAVSDVSFSVEPGETIGLVGESGCGKSMTGNSIMRLLPPGGRIVSGSISLDGRELVGLPESSMRSIRGNEIGMVFQDPMTSLNPAMTVGRQIAEAVELHNKVSRKESLARAVDVLGLVGMPSPMERLNDYPHQLSGGLRQRVMLAIALACEPRLLIGDEPTTALDVTIQAQILDLLDSLRQRLGMAVILITHDMGVIAGRTDSTLVMYAGKIVERAATRELFSDPRHPYTEALLASIPKINMDPNEQLYSIPGAPPDLTAPPEGCRFALRCRYAQDRCVAESPVLQGAGSGHLFACFYPLSGTSVANAESVVHEDPQSTRRVQQTAEVLSHDATDSVGKATETSVLAPATEPGDDKEIVLHVEEVSKEFPVTAGILQRRVAVLKAVNGVTFELRAGETFGLVGESGCGKTTVGRMIVSLEQPTGGHVRFGEWDLTGIGTRRLRSVRADLQLMFQDPYASLDPRMRVGPIIREPLRSQRRGTRAEQDQQVRELLAEVGLDPSAADRSPHEFSGGQRQRIGLARALALKPRLIVADEPVSALDVSIRSQILNLMKRLQRDYQLTYLLISHDLSVVRYMADRIGVMYLGRLVEIGAADDIYERTAHPYTAALLQAIPVPDPEVERSKKGQSISGELPSPLNPPSGCSFRTRCPRAKERCATELPVLQLFSVEHRAACHFPLRSPIELWTKERPQKTHEKRES